MSSQIKTLEEKLAFLESLPVDFWEIAEFLKEYGPRLFPLLKTLIESLGSGDPPAPAISFGSGGPSGTPGEPHIYFERYDKGAPLIWFHTGIKGAEWEQVSAIARAGDSGAY